MNNTKYVTVSRKLYSARNKSYFTREHVLVAEEKLGRKLLDTEVVHHIDGNKNNNDPDNLIVFATNADHSAFHQGHEIYEQNGVWHAKPKILKCEICGKEFVKQKGRKTLSHIYCSTECSSKAQRRFEISKEDLLKLLQKEHGNFSKISKMFNVSDNAIRKRCRLFGISTHSSDYR